MHTIGFIGLGVMGAAMAEHIQEAGYALRVYNRSKEKAEELVKKGAVWCDTPGEAASGADAVITIVGFPKDVEEVYFGEEGILNSCKEGAYLIDMTTSAPSLAKKIYDAAKAKGAFALDAPVSGGDVGAKKATLSIMVGGDSEAFAACGRLFGCMGTTIMLAGGPGAGQHMKLANQISIAGTISGVCEMLAYGKAAGLDLKDMLHCIGGGAAGSWQMTNNGTKASVEDYSPGFFIKHFIKDMRIADGEADALNLSLPVLKTVLGMYEEMVGKDEESAELGTQALIRRYER